MDRTTMLEEFPRLMSRIEEEIDELRYLLVIDPNEYDPEIDDEFDVTSLIRRITTTWSI